MSRFVLDPGGSREIGLCPHSQIYPLTVTIIGNMSSCNWENMLSTLNKIPDFHIQIF
jgi:hypothetical protein